MVKEFKGMLNSVEHTLNMYAAGFLTMPVKGLYDDEMLQQLNVSFDNFHIYLIGEVPEVKTWEIRSHEGLVCFDIKIGNDVLVDFIQIPIPENCKLIEKDGVYWLEDGQGNQTWVSDSDLIGEISRKMGKLNFNVRYIGQAYGDEGKRHALDRLHQHSTLQKMAIEGAPPGHILQLILLSLNDGTMMITMFNPFAASQDNDVAKKRITAGLDKMFGTSEAERISLYEASLIRYFRPIYNKQLKDSFPSTNLRILRDCYDKDMQAVCAEISIDDLPYKLYSDVVQSKYNHRAHFDLHTQEDRKSFFSDS